MKKSIAMFLLGATLAFGLALSASIIANAAVKVTKKDMIRVKGSAVKNVRSDFGTWNGCRTQSVVSACGNPQTCDDSD